MEKRSQVVVSTIKIKEEPSMSLDKTSQGQLETSSESDSR